MCEASPILRRNRRGCTRLVFWESHWDCYYDCHCNTYHVFLFDSEEFCAWPDEPFEEMDSTLAVQQFVQQNIRKEPANIDSVLSPPEGQDEGAWKYEHLRQFCMELNRLAVKLQSECNPETCTQMTATEQWIFLCAAHKTPKECPAIDYTRHTLDGAACLLNSNKYFPSRVTIKESSVAKLGSVCR